VQAPLLIKLVSTTRLLLSHREALVVAVPATEAAAAQATVAAAVVVATVAQA
jgi:hypothetical protein